MTPSANYKGGAWRSGAWGVLLCLSQAVWSYGGHTTSLSLGFLSEEGDSILTLQHCCDHEQPPQV